MKEEILNEYDQKRIIYLEYENKIRDLIYSLIKENAITIHTIESRVKDKESLSKKIDKKQDKYTGLDEITDTLGLRIITYFENDVDTIANIIKGEFYLDEKNSVDKRNKNPDSFGYSSLHYVIKLKEPRASLPEYSRFNEINFEIQIRSILQHAWAEIEHDIGYKSAIEIPVDMRRDFSRIAGLLELADLEFIRIKKEINKYSKEVQENIKDQNLDIPIDKVTLTEFIKESTILKELDELIAMQLGSTLKWREGTIENNIKRLEFLRIYTIGELNNKLENNKAKIISFCKNWIKRLGDHKTISIGISIFYLGYVLVGESQDSKYVRSYVEKMNIGSDYEKTSERIIKTYTEIQ